jgi:lipid II:glycine glycyltransferase (peptidoglycan interpeptide bridge formation enzyme)
MVVLHSSIADINLVQWQSLVVQSANASYFQTPECYNFYNTLSFLTPFLYGVSENDKLVGVMCGYIIADGNPIKQYFSKRAIVPGGVLIDKSIGTDTLNLLLESVVNEISKHAIYLEIRNYNNYSEFKSNFEKVGFVYNAHLNFHVDTTDSKSALNALSDTKKRQLKNAVRVGVEWSETTELVDVRVFYSCLQHIYKTKVRTPLFPVEFFEKLVALQNGKILIAKQNQRIIGGMACVILPNNTLYEWFVCGDESVEKEYYPSLVATWAGIEYAAKNNIPRFDFMGAGKPDDDYGVRTFKSKFGGKLVENGRFLYICKPKLFALGKFIVRKLKERK